MNIRCGHLVDRSFANNHNGLCRKCHSNFSFLLDLEEKFGEDVAAGVSRIYKKCSIC